VSQKKRKVGTTNPGHSQPSWKRTGYKFLLAFDMKKLEISAKLFVPCPFQCIGLISWWCFTPGKYGSVASIIQQQSKKQQKCPGGLDQDRLFILNKFR
jgi:hypothetical protein